MEKGAAFPVSLEAAILFESPPAEGLRESMFFMQEMLDNPQSIMVEYFKLNTAVNGKSNQVLHFRESGPLAGSPDRCVLVNVHPGAGAFPE